MYLFVVLLCLYSILFLIFFLIHCVLCPLVIHEITPGWRRDSAPARGSLHGGFLAGYPFRFPGVLGCLLAVAFIVSVLVHDLVAGRGRLAGEGIPEHRLSPAGHLWGDHLLNDRGA